MFKENFTRRHIGLNSSELNKILGKLGVKSVEQLLEQTIPGNIRLKNDLNIPEGISEMEFLKEIKKLSSLNQKFKTYIGQVIMILSPPLLFKEIFWKILGGIQLTPLIKQKLLREDLRLY